MSSKRIQIELVASGGQTVANEIKKVETAAAGAAKQFKDPSGRTGLAPAGAAAAGSLQEISRAAPQVERSSRNMGAAVLSLSQGFEDAQYGIRGVLNNIPSLVMQLGGTMGLAGVVSLAAVSLSVLGPKISSLFGGGEASKGAEDLTKKLEELRQKAVEVAGAKSAAAAQEWLDALDDEEQTYLEQNEAISRQIELIRARREAQLGVDTARRDADIARVQAAPNLDEATKIREVAKIRQNDERARAQAKIDDLEAIKQIAIIESQQAAATATRQQADAAASAKRLADLEAEKAALTGRVQAADAAAKAIPEQEKAIQQARLATLARLGPGMAGSATGQQAVAAAIAPLEEELNLTRQQAASASVADRTRLGAIPKEIAEIQSGTVLKESAAEAATIAAREAAARAAQVAQLAAIKAPAIRDEFTARSEARSFTTEAAARAATESAGRRADQQSRDQNIQTLEGSVAGQTAGLNRTSAAAGRRVIDAGMRSGNSILQSIGNKLADGTDAAELERIALQIYQNQNKLGQANITALQTILVELKKQADQIENLKGQIKTARTNK